MSKITLHSTKTAKVSVSGNCPFGRVDKSCYTSKPVPKLNNLYYRNEHLYKSYRSLQKDTEKLVLPVQLSLQKVSCRTLKRDPTPTVATHLETSSLVNSNYGLNSRRPNQKVQNRLLLTRTEHELQQLHSRLDNPDTTSASGYCLRP